MAYYKRGEHKTMILPNKTARTAIKDRLFMTREVVGIVLEDALSGEDVCLQLLDGYEVEFGPDEICPMMDFDERGRPMYWDEINLYINSVRTTGRFPNVGIGRLVITKTADGVIGIKIKHEDHEHIEGVQQGITRVEVAGAPLEPNVPPGSTFSEGVSYNIQAESGPGTYIVPSINNPGEPVAFTNTWSGSVASGTVHTYEGVTWNTINAYVICAVVAKNVDDTVGNAEFLGVMGKPSPTPFGAGEGFLTNRKIAELIGSNFFTRIGDIVLHADSASTVAESYDFSQTDLGRKAVIYPDEI
jgi:hypothetical protein